MVAAWKVFGIALALAAPAVAVGAHPDALPALLAPLNLAAPAAAPAPLGKGAPGLLGALGKEPGASESSACALEAPLAQSGGLTATAVETLEEGVADGGLLFYAERTVTVTGSMDLDTLAATLRTFNGMVAVGAGEPDAWFAEFRLRGEGATPVDARMNLENIALTWTTEGADGLHVLDVAIEPKQALALPVGGKARLSLLQQGHITVMLPPAVLVALDAATSNGPVEVHGLQAALLNLASSNGPVFVAGGEAAAPAMLCASTSNGPIQVEGFAAGAARLATSNGPVSFQGAAASLEAVTSNGPIELRLTPIASGTVTAASSNGPVAIVVPEGPDFGYQVSLATSRGEAHVGLEDGEAQVADDGASATFETTGFAERAIQVVIDATTSSGPASVEPA